MSDNQTTNLNNILIDICRRYQLIVRDLQESIQKIYICDDPEEIHKLILEAHTVYTLKLKEVDGLIQALKVEMKVKQQLGISVYDIIKTIH
jgi:hypothetical protein